MEEVGKRRLTFGILVLFTITFIIMLSGFSSAAHMCADSQVILRLSGTTNAHAEAWNGAGGYTEEICYDDIFPGETGSGDRSCGVEDEFKVVGLSGSTNAHAEKPSLSNYATDICYKDLVCNLRSSCETEETEVLSLSSSTNAHLATAGGYSNKICCSAVILVGEVCGNGIIETGETCDDGDGDNSDSCPDGVAGICQTATCGDDFTWNTDGGTETCDDGNTVSGDGCSSTCQIEPTCSLTSATWNVSTAVEGSPVSLEVTTSNCEGQTVSFVVWEKDVSSADDPVIINPSNAEVSGGSASGSWIAEFQEDVEFFIVNSNPPEYYFIATIGDKEITSSDPLLTVSQIPPPLVSCSLTSASWNPSGEVIEGTPVDMIVEGTDCDGQSVDFFIAEADWCIGTCDYGDIDTDDTNKLIVSQPSGSFSGTQAVVSWTTEWVKDDNNGFGDDDPEYVFKAELSDDSDVNIDDSGELKVILAPIDYCPDKPVVTCGDYYTLEDTTAETACNANICPGVAVYSIEITGGSCGEGMRCFCEWDTSDGVCKAESSGGEGPTEGYCKYYTTTEGSCEGGGFLIAEWTAEWIGESGDPRSAKCVDGSRTIECPAQIQLAFFNLYNMLITLLAIAGIYGILSLKKKD